MLCFSLQASRLLLSFSPHGLVNSDFEIALPAVLYYQEQYYGVVSMSIIIINQNCSAAGVIIMVVTTMLFLHEIKMKKRKRIKIRI